MSNTRLPKNESPVNPRNVSGISPQVEIFDGKGVFMCAGVHIGNPTGKGGGKRGKVKGWSKASRRRMRNFLMTHRCTKEKTFGVTFTIPGPPVEPEKAQLLFKNWARKAQKKNICAVWRLEIQKRGQLHWHLFAGCDYGPATEELSDIWIEQIKNLGWVGVWYDEEKHGRLVRALEEGPDYELDNDYWAAPGEVWPGVTEDQLDFFEGNGGPKAVLWLRNRWMIPGANKRCIQKDYTDSDGEQRWYRYLFDHSSKRKQEQIPVGVGRHWGIMGRSGFEQVMPDESSQLTLQEYSRVVRWLQRLCTPQIPSTLVPFGSRLGFSPRRGHWGKTTWFSRPDTVRRMVEHSKALSLVDPASVAKPRGFGAPQPSLASHIQSADFEVSPY